MNQMGMYTSTYYANVSRLLVCIMLDIENVIYIFNIQHSEALCNIWIISLLWAFNDATFVSLPES